MLIALALLFLAGNHGTAAYGGDLTCFFQHDMSKNSKLEGGQLPSSPEQTAPSKKEISSYDATKMKVEGMQAALAMMRDTVEQSVANNIKQSALTREMQNRLMSSAAEIQKSMNSAKEEEFRLAKEKEGLGPQAAAIEQGISEQKEQLQKQIQELKLNNEQREYQLNGTRQELLKTHATIRTEINQLTFQEANSKVEMGNYPDELQEIDQRIDDIKNKITQLDDRITKEKKKNTALKEELPKLETQASTLLSQKQNLSKEFQDVKKEWDSASSKLSVARQNIAKERVKITQQEKNIHMIKSEVDGITQTNNDLKDRSEKSSANLQTLEKHAKDLKDQVEKIKPEVEHLQSENDRLKDILGQDTNHLLQLENAESDGIEDATKAVQQASADVRSIFADMVQKVDDVKKLTEEADIGE